MRFVTIPQEIEQGVKRANAILKNTDHICVKFEKAACLKLSMQDDVLVIGYSRKSDAFRGMSMAARFWNNPVPVCQTARFEKLSVMVDCSRNAVPSVQSLKEFMVYLALMGFNSMMLYTEDTYEIPEQPYFGHMRGRYTIQELQELDAFGDSLGIEMIPCIQTLAHLNGIFKWGCFEKVHDIDDIMLADCEDTYVLVEQMLKSARMCFRSKYINIGMDEAHNLGRGQYLDKFGLEKKPDIMLRHLDKVVELCRKYNFEPVMWSDMFFRMQFDGKYHVDEGDLSQEVISKIPEDVALCYWNYFTPPEQENMLKHMMEQHRKTNRTIWFAGGSWAWYGHTPKNYFSNQVTPLQLSYAEKYGIKNVIATVWGDDGGECPVWNVLPSLLQYAELCYGDANDDVLNDRSIDCFGLSYTDFLKIDLVGKLDILDKSRNRPPCLERMALFNDAMQGLVDAELEGRGLPEKYARDAQMLKNIPHSDFDYLFDTQQKLADFLAVKAELSLRIKQAYRTGDKEALDKIAADVIPVVEDKLSIFHEALRYQWHRINKPFGFEAQDIRMGGIAERLKTTKWRICQYLNGEITRLEELEQADLPYHYLGEEVTDWLNIYGRLVTAGRLSW